MTKFLQTIAAVLGLAKAKEIAAAMREPMRRQQSGHHHPGRVGHGFSRNVNTSQRSRSNRRSAKRAARVRRKEA